MKRRITGVFAGILLLSGLALTSCTKEEETIATVVVKNTLGNVVQGAEVHLYAYGDPDGEQIGEIRFDTIAVTNASGKVSFNFSSYYKPGQAGFAILDIEATKGSLQGTGLIKIEEMKTNEETVTID